MSEEIKTMAIPVMLNEAQATGLITDDAQKAFEAEKLQAQERIRYLEKLQSKKIISAEDMQVKISQIKSELKEKVIALGFDAESFDLDVLE